MKKSDEYIAQYSLYNRAEEIVFTGSAKECMDYMGVSYDRDCVFYSALYNGSRALGKYYIYSVDPIKKTEKRCSLCGKVKPIEEFPYRSKKTSNARISWCRRCKSEYDTKKNTERRLKKRMEKKEKEKE